VEALADVAADGGADAAEAAVADGAAVVAATVVVAAVVVAALAAGADLKSIGSNPSLLRERGGWLWLASRLEVLICIGTEFQSLVSESFTRCQPATTITTANARLARLIP